MNYQEFKKGHFKTLTKQMADIGFVKGKNVTPTYWRFPCADQRLVWVVRFEFFSGGSEDFRILIGPYWMGERLDSDDPFPNCVGYRGGFFGRDGVNGRDTVWQADASQFDKAVALIATHGVRYFSAFDTPHALLDQHPIGILAFDLEEHQRADELLYKELVELHVGGYSTCSTAAKVQHAEHLARTVDGLRRTARALGIEQEADARLLRAQGEGARRMVNTLRNVLRQDPKSRWAKSTLKACEMQVLASGLTLPNPKP
jgi:hypothetical protein